MVIKGATMQYHIFEINAFRQLTHLQAVDDYRSAKIIVRDLRKDPGKPSGSTYRMMFAADVIAAERLLKEKREPRPMGEHD